MAAVGKALLQKKGPNGEKQRKQSGPTGRGTPAQRYEHALDMYNALLDGSEPVSATSLIDSLGNKNMASLLRQNDQSVSNAMATDEKQLAAALLALIDKKLKAEGSTLQRRTLQPCSEDFGHALGKLLPALGGAKMLIVST
eukprot:COSAG04_NODE_13394_length_608_cov_0.697446_1_plen_140_part_10